MFAATIAWPHVAGGQAGPAEDVFCRYLERGQPGPADNELQITTTDYVGAVEFKRRTDDEVAVSEDDQRVACSGAEVPSVSNLDRISVRVSREAVDAVVLDLRNGPFAPGATAEADGTAEIEISLEQAPETELGVRGTSSSDHVQLGSLGGGGYGANLNAGIETAPDADVVARNAGVFLALGKGDDRVDPLGRAAFATRPFNASFSALGGGGDDVLVGNDRRNVLIGKRGRDRLVGNRVSDLLLAGPGPDRIEARSRDQDRVGCGAGRDVLRADRADRLRGCE